MNCSAVLKLSSSATLCLFIALLAPTLLFADKFADKVVDKTNVADRSVEFNDEPTLSLLQQLPDHANAVIDVRPKLVCQKKSISSAVCLPPEHIVADNHRLANFSGLFWALGTVGLSGNETVYIIGDNDYRKQLIAGWLLISGQYQIRIVSDDFNAILDNSERSFGVPKQPLTTRSSVFTAMPRTDRVLTRTEVLTALSLAQPATLIDGRSEAEYWGRTVRSIRGGHLPGAVLHNNKETDFPFTSKNIIAYAHNATDGLALLTRLELQSIKAKLYLGGWADWSINTNLPADAETYHDAKATLKGSAKISKNGQEQESVATVARDESNKRIGFGQISNVFQIGFLILAVLSRKFLVWYGFSRSTHVMEPEHG